ncbi:uncharacterized protein [Macrobrachium rosenbergii]|uniref:uncharacterized protein n=1 Tax=Macrobrachium rosenbergii TaxID=79674 RepID=UPI0034D5FB66
MKKITVSGLLEVSFEGHYPYAGYARPQETSKICVNITDINCTSEVVSLDSQYLSLENKEYVLGEAVSLVDLALEKAFSVMVHDEVACVVVNLPGGYFCDGLMDNVSLTAKVHLEVKEPAKSVFDLTCADIFAIAVKYKNIGVDLYREGTSVKHLSAYLFFCKAVKWLAMIGQEDTNNSLEEIKAIKMQCYNNVALYHLNKKHYSLVVTSTTKVLEVESTNIKALYRRAVANTELQNYEEAESDLKLALTMDPHNVPIKKQQEVLKKRQKAVSEKYAAAMKKLFS